MGNCGSTSDCSQLPDELKLDADIGGIGTLVAFLSAATLTCAAIWLSYFKDMLPENLLSHTDRQLLRRPRRSSSTDDTPKRPRFTREQRVQASSRFILALSDQQLVTGLAVTIAFLANRCRTNFYELEHIYTLTWLSATIHLGTMMVLREYFFDHRLVRNCRLLGIGVFLCLLCVTKGILATGHWRFDQYETPVRCIIKSQTGLAWLTASDVLVEYVPLAYILILYISSICALFEDPRDIEQLPGVIKAVLWLEAKSKKRRANTATVDQTKATNSTVQLQFLLRHRQTWHTILGSGAASAYRHSFLSHLPVLAFHFSYGLVQTIILRVQVWMPPESPAVSMTFGQITAVALLALPCLAIIEIYNEARRVGASDGAGERLMTTAKASRITNPKDLRGKDLADFIYQDIEQHIPPDAGFDQRRCVSTALSLLHFLHGHASSPANRVVKFFERHVLGFQKHPLSPVVILFVTITASQLIGAVALNMLAFNNDIKLAIFGASSFWRLGALGSFFFEIRLRRRLVTSQLFVQEKLVTLGDKAGMEITEDMVDLVLASGGRQDNVGDEVVRDDADGDSDHEPPRRQDTEADIGLCALSRQGDQH